MKEIIRDRIEAIMTSYWSAMLALLYFPKATLRV